MSLVFIGYRNIWGISEMPRKGLPNKYGSSRTEFSVITVTKLCN